MKVSILMATYNKFDCLPNTLVSLREQHTRHEIELCVVDDCSWLDPFPIFQKFCTTFPLKYRRLPANVGYKHSLSYTLPLISLDTEAVILQSCDTMYGSQDLLQTLVDELKPGFCVMPETRNLPVSTDLFQYPDLLPRYLEDKVIDEMQYFGEWGDPNSDFQFYSGPRQPDPDNRWYFFIGAILLSDLRKTHFHEICYDAAFHLDLKSIGQKMIYIPKIAIHQKHRRLNRVD
jgi:hypothetical protein